MDIWRFCSGPELTGVRGTRRSARVLRLAGIKTCCSGHRSMGVLATTVECGDVCFRRGGGVSAVPYTFDSVDSVSEYITKRMLAFLVLFDGGRAVVVIASRVRPVLP